MSVKALTWAFNVKVKNPRAKLVLLALADSANADTDQCWPSVTFVAGKCEMGRATAYRAIAYLERRGLLKHEERRHPDGGSRSPLFTLLIGVSQSDTPGVSDNETRGVPAVRRQEEPKLEPSLRNKKEAANGNGGKAGRKGKPRQAIQSKRLRRIWFDKGTPEFNQYAADYFEKRGVPVTLQHEDEGGGAWFYIVGEP